MKRYEIIMPNLLCVKKNDYITFGNEQLNLDRYCLINSGTGYE